MAEAKFLKPDTLALHAGQHPDPVTGSRAVPIYQTTSFVFRDVDHAASLFNLEVGGHIYSRISNQIASCIGIGCGGCCGTATAWATTAIFP